MIDLVASLGLLVSAFASATLLPMQSEGVLAALIVAGSGPLWALVAVASVGNVLGATLNWALGRWAERFRDRRWFPASPDRLRRAQDFYRRHGRWSLLLSWVPVVGDPLTLVAGLMRERLPVFLALVAIGKIGRYLVVALAAAELR